MTFRCPASTGRVFCPLACTTTSPDPAERAAEIARQEQIARELGRPIIPKPPTEATAPKVCEQGCTSFSLDAHQYKQWQVAMLGTKKHEGLGKGGRSVDEAFHGFMTSGVGAQFREDRFLIRNGTAMAIFTAMVVADVNRSLLEAHDLYTKLAPPEGDAA